MPTISLHFETNPNSPKPDADSMRIDVQLEMGATTCTHTEDPNHIYHAKLIGDKWVMHKEDGPAIIHPECVWFFHNGINYMIPDMPIDNEMKLILAIKYSLNSEYNVGFATYV